MVLVRLGFHLLALVVRVVLENNYLGHYPHGDGGKMMTPILLVDMDGLLVVGAVDPIQLNFVLTIGQVKLVVVEEVVQLLLMVVVLLALVVVVVQEEIQVLVLEQVSIKLRLEEKI